MNAAASPKGRESLTDRLKLLLRRGRRAFALRDVAAAREVFEEGARLARQASLTGEAAVFEATMLLANKKYDEVIGLLAAVVDRDFSMRGHAWDRLALAYSRKREFDKAIECYKKALADRSYDTPGHAWNNIGLAYSRKREFDKAIECYKKALADKSYDTPGYAWGNMGRAYAEKKQFDKAIECNKKALADKSNDAPGNAWNNMGTAYYHKREFDKAIECCKKALADRSYQTPGHAWNNMGLAYAGKKQFDKAIECYQKALAGTSHETPGGVWINLGLAYSDMRRFNKAIECYAMARKAYTRSGDGHGASRADALLQEVKHLRSVSQAGLTEFGEKVGSLVSAATRETAKSPAMRNLSKLRLIDSAARSLSAVERYASGGESDLDNVFVALKGWSSSTPLVSTLHAGAFADQRCRGGGYFLKVNGRGVAIDPGHDFLTNFAREGIRLKEIAAVVVSHNHPDHNSDLLRIADIDRQCRQTETVQRESLRYYLDDDTSSQFRDLLSDFAVDIEADVYPMRDGDEKKLTDDVTCRAFRTLHKSPPSVKCPIGFVFEMILASGTRRRIGYTSDTRFDGTIAKTLGGCDILLCHFSSARTKDITDGELNSKHLGYTGLKELINATDAELYVVSEFWGGIGDVRFDLIQDIAFDFASRGRKNLRILAADVGLRIDLETLGIYCSSCARLRSERERRDKPTNVRRSSRAVSTGVPACLPQPFEKIHMVRPGEYGTIQYVCDHCLV